MSKPPPAEDKALRRRATANPCDPDAARIGADTFTIKQPSPEFVVDDLLVNDVGSIIAAGGIGKTTLALNLAAQVILGKDVFGRRVNRPGPVLLVSAEDDKPRIKYRLYMLGQDLLLTEDERERIGAALFVQDFSDVDARLVKLDSKGNLEETALVDQLIESYAPLGLSLAIFDPFVSFGPGERLVNDAEQSVVKAARRIRKALNCPVLFLMHTGQASARAQHTDQYAGRGGSAAPDGFRMVYVVDKAIGIELPAGIDTRDHADGKVFRLSRAKFTDGAPWPDPLWLVRQGFRFDFQPTQRQSPEALAQQQAKTIQKFVRDELRNNVRHTRSSLEALQSRTGLGRNETRAAVHLALERHWLVERELPEAEKRGARKTYLDHT